MAELEHPQRFFPDDPLGAPNISQPQSNGRNTPAGGGHNADEAIMIGSSDEEDEGPAPPRRPTPAGSLLERMNRLHGNRRGTPIPRAPENGLRIMSPPPPLPGLYHFPMLHDHPGLPRLRPLDAPPLSARLFMPHALRQLSRADRLQVLRIFQQEHIGIPFGPLMDIVGYPPERPGPPAQPEGYDVRMTHASLKPRMGYTFDFAPDEETEEAPVAAQPKPATPPPQVRTRTTIIIPDSPPARPVDHKGKGRARDEDLDQDDLNFKDDPDETINLASSPVGSPSPSRTRRDRSRRRPEAVEIVEFLSDDELDHQGRRASGSGTSAASVASSSQAAQPEKIQTVLVCASCRLPLRTGGDRLWALRCGHMVDSRCYHKFAEGPVEEGEDRVLTFNSETAQAEPSTSGRPARKRRRTNRNKGKGKGPAPPPVPQVIETLHWKCPVAQCRRVHKSEHIMTGDELVWQPAKEDGAIKVFI